MGESTVVVSRLYLAELNQPRNKFPGPFLENALKKLATMHRVLQIPEMLSNIFDHCSPMALSSCAAEDRRKAAHKLATLARMCHAFKEPALDALWRGLDDLSPLARCLPEASRRLSRESTVSRFVVLVTKLCSISHSFSSAVHVVFI